MQRGFWTIKGLSRVVFWTFSSTLWKWVTKLPASCRQGAYISFWFLRTYANDPTAAKTHCSGNPPKKQQQQQITVVFAPKLEANRWNSSTRGTISPWDNQNNADAEAFRQDIVLISELETYWSLSSMYLVQPVHEDDSCPWHLLDKRKAKRNPCWGSCRVTACNWLFQSEFGSWVYTNVVTFLMWPLKSLSLWVDKIKTTKKVFKAIQLIGEKKKSCKFFCFSK